MDFHAIDMKKLQSLCQNHGFKATDWTKGKMIQFLSTIYKGNNMEIIDLDPDSGNGVPKEDSDTVAGKDADEMINVTSEVKSNSLVFHDLSDSGTAGNAHVYEVRLASEVDILSDLHDFLGIKKVEEKEVDMIEMWRNMPLFSPTHISAGYDYQYMDGEDSQKVDQFIENDNIIETTNYQYTNGKDSQQVDQYIENDNIIETSSLNHLVLPRVRNSVGGKNSQVAPRKKTMKQQARAKGKTGGSNASLKAGIELNLKGVPLKNLTDDDQVNSHRAKIVQKRQDTSIPLTWLSSSPIDVETMLMPDSIKIDSEGVIILDP